MGRLVTAQQDWAVVRFVAGMKPSPSGCIEWTKARNSRGYGVFWYEGKLRLAHRVAFFFAHGRWPADGMTLDHRCDNKPCVNADHLRELTNRDNVLRAPASPMNVLLAADECRNGHPYDETTTIDQHGWRVCARCPSRRGRVT